MKNVLSNSEIEEINACCVNFWTPVTIGCVTNL